MYFLKSFPECPHDVTDWKNYVTVNCAEGNLILDAIASVGSHMSASGHFSNVHYFILSSCHDHA